MDSIKEPNWTIHFISGIIAEEKAKDNPNQDRIEKLEANIERLKKGVWPSEKG